jgi:hypothetical protein
MRSGLRRPWRRAKPPRALDVRTLQNALIEAGRVIREDQVV